MSTEKTPGVKRSNAELDTPQQQKFSPRKALKHGPMWRSSEGLKVLSSKGNDNILYLAGNANPELAQAVVERLGASMGKMDLKRFADGEVFVKVDEIVRGKDVYIIQSTSTPVNEHLMELLLMISTLRRASAKRITAVVPYYGYARQDRKVNSRTPISAADVAKLLETMGLDRMISVDLHCGQIQGFFSPQVPIDNLQGHIIGLDWFSSKEKMKNPVCIVAPDAGGVYRAKQFQDGMTSRGISASLAMLIKHRSKPNEIESVDMVGDVKGCDAIIVDDIVDTAGTLCAAAGELKRQGAARVFAFITHGIFSHPAVERIEKSALEELLVTDTVRPVTKEAVDGCKKIKVVSAAMMIADAVRRVHQKESLMPLFDHKSYADAGTYLETPLMVPQMPEMPAVDFEKVSP